MATNYVSLYNCVNYDGKPIDFLNNPLYADITAQDIVFVKLDECLNIQQQLVPAFLLMLNAPGQLKYVTAYLYLTPTLSTIQQLQSGLAQLGTSASFTQYLNLLSIDYKVQNTTGQSILINDKFVVPNGRRYLQYTGSTFVSVKVDNKLLKTKFEFAGNQTLAGNYLYLY